MRRLISIDYQNTKNLTRNLRGIVDNLENEKRKVKQALGELYDLENYYINRNSIIEELEYRERQIHKDIDDTEDLIINIDSFSNSVKETDEALAHRFKQDIKGYAKENNIEIVSEFEKWVNRAQLALDAWGTISPGPVADGVNALIYLLRGDIKNSLISLVGIVPYIGDSAKGIRYLDKASDVLKFIDKTGDLGSSSKKIVKASDKLNIKNISLGISNNKSKVETSSNIVKGVSQVGEELITYRRVQGGTPPNASWTRITIGESGNIKIPNKNANLNVSTGNDIHAKYFLSKRGNNAEIVEFDIPKWLDNFLNENVIDQKGYKKNPLNQGGTAPKIVDRTTPGNSYELPAPWIEWIEEYAKNGKIKR